MKQIIAKPLSNIYQCVIGKITFKSVSWLRRKNFILVSPQGKSGFGYAAILTTNNNQTPKGTMLLCSPSDILQLAEGDVVSIDNQGNIVVLYEKNSAHNFLLVTERCNCACIMCPNPLVTREEDNTARVMKVISLIDQDAPVLGISGGEPTLLGDKLIEVIRACKKKLPRTELLLLTNGMKLEDFNYVKEIVSIQHPNLTIDIPLCSDTDTDHDHIMGANGFYKTIEGLYNLARFNQKVGIRIVMHKLNYKRLPQIAEFIYHNFPFVCHVAFMQMETTGRAKINSDQLWMDPYDYNSELEQAVTCLRRRAMNVSVYNAPLCILPRTLWQYAKQSISTWKNIYLEECQNCDYKNHCAGFFASSLDWHSNHIKAIKQDYRLPRNTPFTEKDLNKKYYASVKSYRKQMGEHWVYFSPNHPGFPVVVSEITHQLFESFKNGQTIQEVKEVYQRELSFSQLNDEALSASIKMLIDKGFLRESIEPKTYQAAPLVSIEDIKTISIWIHITNQCNLQCDYCFVKKSSQEMSEDTIREIVLAVINTAKKYHLQEVKVNFAGGEPTLVMPKIEIFHRLLKEGLEEVGAKLSMSIVSNGTLINDELIDFLHQENCGISLSLDGYGVEGHDIYRKFKGSQQGSWKLIEKNIQRLIDQGIIPYIMSTISELSASTLTDLMRWILEKGLRTRLRIVSNLNTSCVQAACAGTHQLERMDVYINAFESMFTELEKEKYSFDVGNIIQICDLHFEYPAYTSCCEMATYHLTISHEGKLTFCPMDVNNAGVDLGDDLLDALRKTIHFDTIDRNQSPYQTCLGCQWFPVCVGGCPYSNMQLYQTPFAQSRMHDFYSYVIPRYIEFYGKKLLQRQQAEQQSLDNPLSTKGGYF